VTTTRLTQRQLAKARNVVRREEMDCAVAEGRLIIRRMTAHERDQSDARWAAAMPMRNKRR
jgi:hypothetical protein